MTPSGIEPATFRFVAQYLKHCATISGPQSVHILLFITVRTQQYPYYRTTVRLNKHQGNMFRPTSGHHQAIIELST
jgi:hypothetical protein